MDIRTFVGTPISSIKKMEKEIRKLTKSSSHSYSLVIPKEIIKKYGWKEKQKLVIRDKGRGKVEIRDWRSR